MTMDRTMQVQEIPYCSKRKFHNKKDKKAGEDKEIDRFQFIQPSQRVLQPRL